MARLSTDKGFYATINCGFDKEYNPLMEYLDYARRLKELQTDKGIKTQIELSAWMGFSKSIISAWMRGEKIPSMDTALKIAALFDVCVEWLLTGKGQKSQNDLPYLRDVIDVTHLTPEQLTLIKGMIAQFEQVNPKKDENKSLTYPTENVGGGSSEPIQQPQAQDRRTVTRRMGSAAAKESFYEMVTTTCKRPDDY